MRQGVKDLCLCIYNLLDDNDDDVDGDYDDNDFVFVCYNCVMYLFGVVCQDFVYIQKCLKFYCLLSKQWFYRLVYYFWFLVVVLLVRFVWLYMFLLMSVMS